jgi:hypothetical protein
MDRSTPTLPRVTQTAVRDESGDWIDIGTVLTRLGIDSVAERAGLVGYGAVRFFTDDQSWLLLPAAQFAAWIKARGMATELSEALA